MSIDFILTKVFAIGIGINSCLNQSPLLGAEERRNFFDGFASVNNFDPSDPNKWYSITYKKIINFVSEHFIILFLQVLLTERRFSGA
jgi:hypothetical protein